MGVVKNVMPLQMAGYLFGRFTVIMRMAMVSGNGGESAMPDLLSLREGLAAMGMTDTPSHNYRLKNGQQYRSNTKPFGPDQRRLLCLL